MKFINQLQKDNADLKQQLQTTQEEINQFISFLHSPKFIGTENGERKDWISTGDVIARLINLRSHTLTR